MINMLHIRCLIRDDIVVDWHLLLCYTLYSAFAKVKEFDGVMNDKVVILLHSWFTFTTITYVYTFPPIFKQMNYYTLLEYNRKH